MDFDENNQNIENAENVEVVEEKSEPVEATYTYSAMPDYNPDNLQKTEPKPEPKPEPKKQSAPEPKEKKQKKGTPVWLTVVLCLICSVIGGMCVFGASRFFVNDAPIYSPDSGLTDPNNNPNDPNNNPNGNSGNTGAITPIDNKDVTIEVKSVESPASAVAEKVLPSIVGISVTYKTEVSSWFFGTQETESTSEGSGIIYSSDGYIITNHHVIEGALTNAGELSSKATIKVYLYTDSSTAIDASIVGYDISSDLAVLKIDKTGLTAIEIGDSDKVVQGDIAIAVGNPGGLEFMGSLSQGIISGLNRTITVEGNTYKDVKLIQTDAAINPGNSGGALVNVQGQLIGVNSVKLVEDGFEGMGFAIPVNYVVSVVKNIIENPNSSLVYLGIEENTSYTADLLEKNGYPGGIVVGSVAKDSPAANAGIQTVDIIVEFNGETVRTMSDLNTAKQKCTPGDTVIVKVYRMVSRTQGKYYELSVTLA